MLSKTPLCFLCWVFLLLSCASCGEGLEAAGSEVLTVSAQELDSAGHARRDVLSARIAEIRSEISLLWKEKNAVDEEIRTILPDELGTEVAHDQERRSQELRVRVRSLRDELNEALDEIAELSSPF